MEKLITLVILIILQFNLHGQSKMITTKIFSIEDIFVIHVPSEIKCNLNNCKGKRMLIEATISANCSDQVLNSLFKAGVFSIVGNKCDNKIMFLMPNLHKVKFVKNKELKINVTWKILMPDEIKFITSI